MGTATWYVNRWMNGETIMVIFKSFLFTNILKNIRFVQVSVSNERSLQYVFSIILQIFQL